MKQKHQELKDKLAELNARENESQKAYEQKIAKIQADKEAKLAAIKAKFQAKMEKIRSKYRPAFGEDRN